MTETSEKILEKIKEGKIAPSPRWTFALKNGIFWCMFVLSLLLGALSFAIIADLLLNNDWDIYLHLHKSFLQYVLLSIPYLWIIILAGFACLAYFDFIHTKNWYHYRARNVVVTSVLSSIFLGTIFYLSGVGRQIDQVMSDRMPLYRFINFDKRKIWCNPHDGLLGGEIVDVRIGEKGIIVKDCYGNDWLVEKVVIRPDAFRLRPGERIKIIGKEIDPRRFEAREFRRW